MSISEHITRILNARNTIRAKLVALGLAKSTDSIDTLANAVNGIANRGAVTASVQEGNSYTIPAGYHNGSGRITGVAGGGDYNLQSKTVEPTIVPQDVTPDAGYYGLSKVTVGSIPPNYVNTDGAMSIDLTIDGIDRTSVDIPAGYTLGGTVSLTSDIENMLAEI